MKKDKKLHYVFIYGTLKMDGFGSSILKDSIFIGNVKTEDTYILYKVGSCISFPAMIFDEKGYQIKGELYLVTDDVLKSINKYECVDEGLFKLENITISDQENIKFSELSVKTYTYNGPINLADVINSDIFKN